MLKQRFQGICSPSDSSKRESSATSCSIGLSVSLCTLIVTYLVFSVINFFRGWSGFLIEHTVQNPPYVYNVLSMYSNITHTSCGYTVYLLPQFIK